MRWLGIAALAATAYAGGHTAHSSGWQTIIYNGTALTAHILDEFVFSWELIPDAPSDCKPVSRSFDPDDVLKITEAFGAVFTPTHISHTFKNIEEQKGFNTGGACTIHGDKWSRSTVPETWLFLIEIEGQFDGTWNENAFPDGAQVESEITDCQQLMDSNAVGNYYDMSLVVHACAPVDGDYSASGFWSPCSVTCGTGTKTMSRTCTNPSPLYGGVCHGDATLTATCNPEPCPVDGGYSEWVWDACSATCGGGMQTGSRTCTNPSPAHGGQNCTEQGLGDASSTPRVCNTQSCNGISAVCNDDNTISVTINYDQDSTILSASYGSCNETDIRGADATGVQQWDLTLDPSSCGMESNLRNLVYNQTAEFTVGFKDGSTKLKLADFEVDTYCNYTSEYTVTFDYGPVNEQSYNFTESGGLIGLNFYIASYSNSSYNVKANPSNSAGDMIYLKLGLNATLNDDFDHAANMDASTGKVFVPTKCGVTDNNSNAYTLFDTAGSTKCKNDIISLSVTYNSGDPQSWYIQHVLFLLNSESSSNYTLQCDILVCDAEQITRCKDAHDCLTAV